jgi:hypothetical protein
MSSATSIKDVRLAEPAPNENKTRVQRGAANNGFRPWHFFMLVSLIAATAAVVMARQATPEQLVLLSFTIGAAGVAAAALYRTLAPLAAENLSAFREPLTERSRAALEREKMLVLRSIKELEFDRAMGKLSTKDFEDMAGRLRARALSLMKQVDEGGTAYREVVERELTARLASAAQQTRAAADSAAADTRTESHVTCQCGTANDADASFCKRCGTRLS